MFSSKFCTVLWIKFRQSKPDGVRAGGVGEQKFVFPQIDFKTFRRPWNSSEIRRYDVVKHQVLSTCYYLHQKYEKLLNIFMIFARVLFEITIKLMFHRLENKRFNTWHIWTCKIRPLCLYTMYRVIGLKLIHFRLTIFSWLNEIGFWDPEIKEFDIKHSIFISSTSFGLHNLFVLLFITINMAAKN